MSSSTPGGSPREHDNPRNPENLLPAPRDLEHGTTDTAGPAASERGGSTVDTVAVDRPPASSSRSVHFNWARVRLLIRKELRQLRRDTFLLRVILLMPIVQLILFGYVVAAEVKHLPTAVIDLDRSSVSRQIDASFAASGYFDVVAHPASEGNLRPLMDTGQIGVGVVIPEGTSDALAAGRQAPIAIVVDGSDAQVASVGSGYAAGLITRFNENLVAVSGLPGTDGRSGGSFGTDGLSPGVDARVQVLYNPTLSNEVAMVPALTATIVMISLLVVVSQAVVREREQGTLEQMFVTPIRPTEYLIGKTVPYVGVALIQVVTTVALGLWWFKVPFYGSWLVAACGVALLMLTAIGMGLAISLVSHTRSQAILAVLFILLPYMILSGLIFPIESMPEAIQWVPEFIPLTHAIRIVRGAALAGAGFADLAWPFLALLAFAVVIFGASVAATGRKLTE